MIFVELGRVEAFEKSMNFKNIIERGIDSLRVGMEEKTKEAERADVQALVKRAHKI